MGVLQEQEVHNKGDLSFVLKIHQTVPGQSVRFQAFTSLNFRLGRICALSRCSAPLSSRLISLRLSQQLNDTGECVIP